MNVFNNVILARNRQLPDDDGMIETCRSIFKSFNVNNLSVCTGWCADQVIGCVHLKLIPGICFGKVKKRFLLPPVLLRTSQRLHL